MKKKVLNFNVFSLRRGHHKKNGLIPFTFGIVFIATYCVTSIVLTQRKVHRLPHFRNRIKEWPVGTRKNTENFLLIETSSYKPQTASTTRPISALGSTTEDYEEIAEEWISTAIPKTTLISNISKPMLRRKVASHPISAWMKDPTSTTQEIYVMENFFNNNKVKVYYNEQNATLSRKHVLPYDWGGTGHVVLDGSIYYNKFNTNVIVKYSFAEEKILWERSIPNAGFGNLCPYHWAGSTDMDLAVDTTGLWVIYATVINRCKMVISRLDPDTLKILSTWTTKIPKRPAGNAFIANGVLYALKNHDVRNTSLHLAFDSNTNRMLKPEISISLKYQYLTMLDYNHKERKLYACDKGHLIVYNLTFS